MFDNPAFVPKIAAIEHFPGYRESEEREELCRR